MKRALITSLLASGFLFAQTKLPENQREALRTQSPAVHTKRMKHRHNKSAEETARTGDRVVSDKHTINAFVPYGK